MWCRSYGLDLLSVIVVCEGLRRSDWQVMVVMAWPFSANESSAAAWRECGLLPTPSIHACILQGRYDADA
jgi:hypothetical protein